MPNPKEIWHVGFDSCESLFGKIPYVHPEDGCTYYSPNPGWVVVIHNEYGYLYIHKTVFNDHNKVAQFVVKVEEHFKNGGQPNLDHWNYWRVMYGTQAYLDEEPAIVAREKSDALWNEFFGR